MQKFFLICALIAGLMGSVYAMDAEVLLDVPAMQRNLEAKTDGLMTLQGMIQAIATAQNVQSQILQLKNLQNFQQNPGAAVNQVNNSVTSLLTSFNNAVGYNTTNITNLSSLISTLSSTSQSEGMSLRLATAANMQLASIQNILQQIQVQQQAMIAYKQAEIAEKNYKEAATAANEQATIDNMNKY